MEIKHHTLKQTTGQGKITNKIRKYFEMNKNKT